MFAEKYLGITDVESEKHERWCVLNIALSSYTEADPDFLFSTTSNRSSSLFYILQKLSADNMILLPENIATDKVFENRIDFASEEILFTDLSVKRNFESGTDITTRKVLSDSSHAKTSKTKRGTASRAKTLEQKAEEAANFIIKTRKRRFKLIAGQYDFMPEGEALGRAVEELNRIESEYVSLFMGKKAVSTHSRTFHFVPENGNEVSRIILVRFSETEGFTDVTEAGGKPVLVEIRDKNKTKGLDNLILSAGASENQLFYRIPDQAFVRILYGEQVFQEALFPVYQFGSLVPVTLKGWKQQ